VLRRDVASQSSSERPLKLAARVTLQQRDQARDLVASRRRSTIMSMAPSQEEFGALESFGSVSRTVCFTATGAQPQQEGLLSLMQMANHRRLHQLTAARQPHLDLTIPPWRVSARLRLHRRRGNRRAGR